MILGWLALVLFAVAVGALVQLHRLPTGIEPVSGAVSDYGATRFHSYYRVMVVALGFGGFLLAAGLATKTDARALAWLYIFGGSRIAIANFMTDRNMPPRTGEGRVHFVLAAIAFTAIAFTAATVSWEDYPSAVLKPLGDLVAVCAVATLVCAAVPQLRGVFGVVERALYATSILWLVIAAVALGTS
jgi:hypothetical protein